jgi:hypothetical protein
MALLFSPACVVLLAFTMPPDIGEYQGTTFTPLIRGQVQTVDGTPLPRQISIDRVCPHGRMREASTDARGGFVLRLGELSSLGDASDYGSSGRMAGPGSGMPGQLGAMSAGPAPGIAGCELTAVASGYRSSSVDLSRMAAGDAIDAVNLYLVAAKKAPGTTISVASLKVPKDARRAFDEGIKEEKQGKIEEARQHFADATVKYPQYAPAWVELWRVCELELHPEQARRAYEQAVAADGKLVAPYLGLAGLAANRQDWPEVVIRTEQALQLDPITIVYLHLLNAVANYNLGRMQAAEASARLGIRLDVVHKLARLHLVLGKVLLRKKEYPAAAQSLQQYLQFTPDAPDRAEVQEEIHGIEKAPPP